MSKIITKCCPDCGSTTGMHNSWCRIHLTSVKSSIKPIFEICVIHNIKLDKFIQGKLGCLLCWKNKTIIDQLEKAIKNGLPHDSYDSTCTEGINPSLIEELKKVKEIGK